MAETPILKPAEPDAAPPGALARRMAARMGERYERLLATLEEAGA